MTLRVVAWLLLLLSGCSAWQMDSTTPAELQLLPPSEGPAPVLLKQKVSLLAGQHERQFLAVARFDYELLNLVVLLPSGQRLLTLTYDGHELTQQSFAEFGLPGTEILAILQFVSWPEASLRAHYPESAGWQVQSSVSERKLLTHSRTALTIAFMPGEVRIDNYLKEYRVIVQTLDKTRL